MTANRPPRYATPIDVLEMKARILRCAVSVAAGFSLVMLLAAWWK
jgi:hypothetical protein